MECLFIGVFCNKLRAKYMAFQSQWLDQSWFHKSNNKNCKENVWIWKFVYHIEGHAIAHKYNLNSNKHIMPKNQHVIKSLNIPKKTSLISPPKETFFQIPPILKTFLIPSKKPQCKIKFIHKLKLKHQFNLSIFSKYLISKS